MTSAIRLPILTFDIISQFKNDRMLPCTANAASIPSIVMYSRLMVLHTHCIHAIPTEMAKKLFTRKAKRLPNLSVNQEGFHATKKGRLLGKLTVRATAASPNSQPLAHQENGSIHDERLQYNPPQEMHQSSTLGTTSKCVVVRGEQTIQLTRLLLIPLKHAECLFPL